MKQNKSIAIAILATSIQGLNAFTVLSGQQPQRISVGLHHVNHLSGFLSPSTRVQRSTSQLRMTRSILGDEKIETVNGEDVSSSTRDDLSEFNVEEYDPSTFMGPTDIAHFRNSGELTSEMSKTSKGDDDKTLDIGEILGLAAWMGALTTFLLVNNYVGPFPTNIATAVPVKAWGLMHGVGGMLFGGGIILTTCIEWLVINSKNQSVWNFWFKKVPDLDSKIVLPALTASIVSGTALAVDHYNSLSQAPFHVTAALGTLLAFAGWWGITDLTTQGRATDKIAEVTADAQDSDKLKIPGILEFRKFSNLVSCGFVAALYYIMITKPGFTG